MAPIMSMPSSIFVHILPITHILSLLHICVAYPMVARVVTLFVIIACMALWAKGFLEWEVADMLTILLHSICTLWVL